MTVEVAARVLDPLLVEESGNGSELSPAERKFCRLMITGPHPENATQTYRLVHPEANYNTAGVAGPALLKESRIEKYLSWLRRRAIEGSEEKLVEELRNWIPVAVKAKRRLEAHIEGTARMTGTDLAVIREVLDRALGRSKETVEHDIGNRLDTLIKELTKQNPSRFERPESGHERTLLAAVSGAPDNGASGERSK